MEPKPKGWGGDYGAVFREASVVERYHLRPRYPAEAIELLAGLASGRPVLEAGCGLGELARALAPRVPRVDAVDVSARMIERGRSLEGGDAPNVRWIHAPVEDAPLEGPYRLVVAGESIHWLDWERALPRFAATLETDGVLAIVYRDWLRDEQLRQRLRPIYARHSSNADFQTLDAVAELERRELFQRVGERTTGSEPWQPTLEELLGCHHSQSGFALDRQEDPAAFDAEVAAVVEQLVEQREGRFQLDVTAHVVWGRPRPSAGGRAARPGQRGPVHRPG